MHFRRIVSSAIGALLCILTTAKFAQAALVISNDETKHVNCSAGVCTPTARNAVLNVSQLQGLLAASDVTVNTGSGAVTIGVSAPLTWASTSRLTLNAANGVAIKAAVVVEGTGALTIAASGGALNFYPGGSISFWDNASNLIIGGQSYTLVSDIATLASDVASNPSGRFALAKSYDASGDSFHDSPITAAFNGTFEGLGNTISSFSINIDEPSYVGLFTEIDGTVRDLALNGSIECGRGEVEGQGIGLLVGQNKGKLKNIAVLGTIFCQRARHVGGIAGYNLAPGVISNVTSSVSLGFSKIEFGGGIAGENTGTIQNASASGNIEAAIAGGLVGDSSGLLQDSHASGNVSNHGVGTSAGGLAGSAQGTILRCSASGSASVKRMAGGLVGYAHSLLIDRSFATGSANAHMGTGGLIGFTDSTVTVTNSYARGAATGAALKGGAAGGLAGSFIGSITASYSTGAPGAAKYRGGAVGNASSTMTNLYWDLDTSGIADTSKGAGNQANYPGITGLSDAQLKSGLPDGFDSAIWGQSPGINDGYPYLLANPPQ